MPADTKSLEDMTTAFVYFYFKQWKETTIPFDGTVVKESDYPIPDHWKRVYRRDCAVQTRFFEALFQLNVS